MLFIDMYSSHHYCRPHVHLPMHEKTMITFEDIYRVTTGLYRENMGLTPLRQPIDPDSKLYKSLMKVNLDYDDRYDYREERVRISNHDGGEYAEELRLDNKQRARDMRG